MFFSDMCTERNRLRAALAEFHMKLSYFFDVRGFPQVMRLQIISLMQMPNFCSNGVIG